MAAADRQCWPCVLLPPTSSPHVMQAKATLSEHMSVCVLLRASQLCGGRGSAGLLRLCESVMPTPGLLLFSRSVATDGDGHSAEICDESGALASFFCSGGCHAC